MKLSRLTASLFYGFISALALSRLLLSRWCNLIIEHFASHKTKTNKMAQKVPGTIKYQL